MSRVGVGRGMCVRMLTQLDPGSRVLAMVLVGLSAACAPAGVTPDWHRVSPPVAAPGFSLPQLDAGPLSLAELRGRVVIMEFWATWCGPCRFSLPSLDVMYKRYRDRGVSVLLINEGETADRVRQWAERRLSAPILLDREQAVGGRYGVQGIPRLFVIDQAGQILYSHSGYGGGLEHNLTLILNELLKGSRSGPHA